MLPADACRHYAIDATLRCRRAASMRADAVYVDMLLAVTLPTPC